MDLDFLCMASIFCKRAVFFNSGIFAENKKKTFMSQDFPQPTGVFAMLSSVWVHPLYEASGNSSNKSGGQIWFWRGMQVDGRVQCWCSEATVWDPHRTQD